MQHLGFSMSTYYFNNKWLTTLYCVLLSNLMPPHIPLYGSYFKSNISNFSVVYQCKLKSDFRTVAVTIESFRF